MREIDADAIRWFDQTTFGVKLIELLKDTLFFMKGKRIIAVHGIRNKAKKIESRDRKIALERKRDWLMRNPK